MFDWLKWNMIEFLGIVFYMEIFSWKMETRGIRDSCFNEKKKAIPSCTMEIDSWKISYSNNTKVDERVG